MSNTYVKFWCEYDICGNFGGNNDEEVALVPTTWTEEKIESELLKLIVARSGCSKEDVENLWSWDYITIPSFCDTEE